MESSVMVKGKGEDRRLGKRLSWAARNSSGQVLKPRVTVYVCPTKAYVIIQHISMLQTQPINLDRMVFGGATLEGG